jgi:hypothetical protein
VQNFFSNKTSTVEFINGKAHQTLDTPLTYNPQKRREMTAAGAGSVEKKAQASVAEERETPLGEPPKTFSAPPKKKQKKRL